MIHCTGHLGNASSLLGGSDALEGVFGLGRKANIVKAVSIRRCNSASPRIGSDSGCHALCRRARCPLSAPNTLFSAALTCRRIAKSFESSRASWCLTRYEPDELPGCSTPHSYYIGRARFRQISAKGRQLVQRFCEPAWEQLPLVVRRVLEGRNSVGIRMNVNHACTRLIRAQHHAIELRHPVRRPSNRIHWDLA